MPRQLLVVENPRGWSLALPEVEVIAARAYLTDPLVATVRRAMVFTLCGTYGYQTVGYYVWLLAAARGHRPLPSVTTIQDLRSLPVLRIIGDDLRRDINRTLGPLKADRFELSIYFGRNMASRYDRLCQALFAHFPAPFLRADLIRVEDGWRLDALRPLGATDIPERHHEFLNEQARRYLARPKVNKRTEYRYDLAILYDAAEIDAPSDERAIRRFAHAASKLGMRPAVIDRDDIARLPEYDALFIRETTFVNHHTYRFARRAEAEGMVVIDDPTSIIRCTNKVYLAELFERYDVPCPRTVVAHKDNAGTIGVVLGFPCVLKRPDSSFSRGVVKAGDAAELDSLLPAFFADSELVVAQKFLPSSFDWRIGVLAGRALFVCRYHMVPGHWQIQLAQGAKRRRYGKVEPVPVAEAPARAIALGERVASLIGEGLYGVDIKEIDGRFFVMEINDNPNIEAGAEDGILGTEVYDAVMRQFVERLERRGRNGRAT
jgi:glutathione synthase/RimK-type ligase-like ATP-grasp enzyme